MEGGRGRIQVKMEHTFRTHKVKIPQRRITGKSKIEIMVTKVRTVSLI